MVTILPSLASQFQSVDVVLVVLCYVYIVAIIVFSSKATAIFKWSRTASRKLLHLLIGNFPFIFPLFTNRMYPTIIAAPFILVTFLVSPYSPFRGIKEKYAGLSEITAGGSPLGLVYYSISYTALAGIFFSTPSAAAAGVLSMAHGDGAGSLVGERFGRHRYKVFAMRSLEGSLAVFVGTFLSLALCLSLYSFAYHYIINEILLRSLMIACIATAVEAISPGGVDNLFVPFTCSIAFYLTQAW